MRSTKALRPLKIMEVGDSLCAGTGSTATGGYRGRLSNTLATRLGYTPKFVGQQYVNILNQPMCGIVGLRIDEITAAPYLLTQLAQFMPDVIICHIGTNDFTQVNSGAWVGGSYNLSVTNLGLMIDLIFQVCPNVTLILADRIIDQNTYHANLGAYNTSRRTAIQARAEYIAGKIITFDAYTDVGVYTTTTYSDDSHLTAAGYALLATSIYNAFITKY